MGLTTMNQIRAILITGKIGTGKSTKALTLVKEPMIVFANDIDIDVGSFPMENGIIIEDVHYKPDKQAILFILRNYRGQIVLTSINEKSVPKEIKSMCSIKRAGSYNFLEESIKSIAPNSEKPFSFERDTYSLVRGYLKERDRDLVAKLLVYNKPPDTQIVSWLSENMHPHRLIFVDGVVKRRWSQEYFYQMLAYAHDGGSYDRLNMPKRSVKSELPAICRKLNLRTEEQYLLKLLLEDSNFQAYAKTKLTYKQYRMFGLGEKSQRKIKASKEDIVTLDRWL